MLIYQYDSNGYATGHTAQRQEREPIPPGWTHKAPKGVEGERFVGNAWQTVPLPAPTVPKEYRQFTPLSVLELFTEEEQLAIVTASMSVPAVRLWYDKLIAATFVSYADPRMDDGLQALVGAGLIAQERKDEIAGVMRAGSEADA